MQEGHANVDLQDWDCYHRARGHRTTKTHPNLVTIMVVDEATTKRRKKKKTFNTIMYSGLKKKLRQQFNCHLKKSNKIKFFQQLACNIF